MINCLPFILFALLTLCCAPRWQLRNSHRTAPPCYSPPASVNSSLVRISEAQTLKVQIYLLQFTFSVVFLGSAISKQKAEL